MFFQDRKRHVPICPARSTPSSPRSNGPMVRSSFRIGGQHHSDSPCAGRIDEMTLGDFEVTYRNLG
jgi:hypothetical protein